jgi:hypothetical protein
MELMLEASRLERFLDLRPKVVVAACDPLATTCPDDSDEPLFDVWSFTPGEESGLLRLVMYAAEPSGILIAVPNPPAATCVLAAQSSEGCTALEILRTWWTAHGACPASPVLCCRVEDAVADILRALLRVAHQEIRDAAAQVTSATAQLYELRCEYEQMRVAADALQHEMHRLRLPPRLMTVSLPPNGQVYAPRDGQGVLVQPLPVSAEGLAGFDLHFPECRSINPAAQVIVRLHALDMGSDLGAWRLLSHHLGKGWVRCWLPEVLAVASHDLEVGIEWHCVGSAPAISLASAGDWDELRARPLGSSRPADGCLALTAWAGGVPGMPLQRVPTWCAPLADDSVEFSLNAEEINRMKLHLPPIDWLPAEWYPFQQRPDGSFMLHPFGSLATTLQLHHGCPAGVERVMAVVQITSPQARGAVQYALAVSPDDDAHRLMDNADLNSDLRFLAFSGWHAIPPDDAPHVIVMDVAAPLSRPAHLLLATRMPAGVDHAWAWADWRDVRLRVRGLQVPAVETLASPTAKRAA